MTSNGNTAQAVNPKRIDALGEYDSFSPGGGLESQTRAEIDQQISTAKRYRRSVTQAIASAETMATMDPETAASCFYKLPRKEADGSTKMIEGPSVRLAEIFAIAWGNLRYGARVIDENDRFVMSQGVCHDLETNVATSIEVRRRITNRQGRKYSDDMIAVTANAANSIALRNAILRVIPKVWIDRVYRKCKAVATGDARTLVQRRQNLIGYLTGKVGVELPRILAVIGRAAVTDVDLNDLETLHGLATAIKEGEATVDEAFPSLTPAKPAEGSQQPQDKASALAAEIAKPVAAAPDATTTPADPPAETAATTTQVVEKTTEVAPAEDDLPEFKKPTEPAAGAVHDEYERWLIQMGELAESKGTSTPAQFTKAVNKWLLALGKGKGSTTTAAERAGLQKAIEENAGHFAYLAL